MPTSDPSTTAIAAINEIPCAYKVTRVMAMVTETGLSQGSNQPKYHKDDQMTVG
ncbi:MAG: hypothetical protein IPF70_08430 [Saprospiraceae bacterium]|nr:hypothetical protein [Saprospiraceae bacterium]